MFENPVILASNKLIRWRRVRVRPADLLLLAPHCLKRQACPHNVLDSMDNCQRCGKCRCKDLLELRDRYGVRLVMASGGRQALAAASDPAVKVVVAIACGRELRAGILKAFPKPIYAIHNRQPHGPCRDTDVAVDEVEKVLASLLKREREGPARRE